MKTTLAALVLLSGCCRSETQTYTAYTDYGGELSISLVGTIGVDLTVAGMTVDELEDAFGPNGLECPPPRKIWSSDDLSWVRIVACVPNVTITSPTGCEANARLYLQVTADRVSIELDPLVDASDNGIDGETYSDDGTEVVLAASGEYSTAIGLGGRCLVGNPVDWHELTVAWDFPLHDEREIENEYRSCPSGGGGWGW